MSETPSDDVIPGQGDLFDLITEHRPDGWDRTVTELLPTLPNCVDGIIDWWRDEGRGGVHATIQCPHCYALWTGYAVLTPILFYHRGEPRMCPDCHEKGPLCRQDCP